MSRAEGSVLPAPGGSGRPGDGTLLLPRLWVWADEQVIRKGLQVLQIGHPLCKVFDHQDGLKQPAHFC